MLNVLNPFQNDLADFANMGTYVYNLAYLVQSQKIYVPTFICVPNDEIFSTLSEETRQEIWKIISELRNNNLTIKQASQKPLLTLSSADIAKSVFSVS